MNRPKSGLRIGVVGVLFATLAMGTVIVGDGSVAQAETQRAFKTAKTAPGAVPFELTRREFRPAPVFPRTLNEHHRSVQEAPVRVHRITISSKSRNGDTVSRNSFYFSTPPEQPSPDRGWNRLFLMPALELAGQWAEGAGQTGLGIVEAARGTADRFRPGPAAIEVAPVTNGSGWRSGTVAKSFSLLMTFPLGR